MISHYLNPKTGLYDRRWFMKSGFVPYWVKRLAVWANGTPEPQCVGVLARIECRLDDMLAAVDRKEGGVIKETQPGSRISSDYL